LNPAFWLVRLLVAWCLILSLDQERPAKLRNNSDAITSDAN